MNVSLTPDLAQRIQKKIEDGNYHSATEVIRAALFLLEEREERDRLKLETLRTEIAIGSEQLKNGNYSEYDERSISTLIDEIQTEGRKKISSHDG